MPTGRHDTELMYQNHSFISYHTLTAGAAQAWGGLGCTASFQPRYTLNPASSSQTEVNEFVLTLAMMIAKLR